MSCRRRKLKNLEGIQSPKTVHNHGGEPSVKQSPDDAMDFPFSSTDAERNENVKEWWRNHQNENGTNDFVRKSEQVNTTSKTATQNGEFRDESNLFRDVRPTSAMTPITSRQERPYDPYQDSLAKPKNGMVLDPRLLPMDINKEQRANLNPSLGIFQTIGRSDSDDGIEFFQPEIVPSTRTRQQNWTFQPPNLNSPGQPPISNTAMATFISEEGEEVSLSSFEANNKEINDESKTRKGRKKLSLSKFMAKKSNPPPVTAEATNKGEFPDHLSDLPSDIDSITRERYLLACEMLKMSIIQKERALIPVERDYILSLLEDFETHSVGGSDLSVDHINSIERAAQTLGNDSISKFPNDSANVELPSPISAARFQKSQNEGGVVRAVNSLSPGSDKNPHTATRSPKKVVEQISNGCNTGIEMLSNNISDRLVRFDGWSFQNSMEYPFKILDTYGLMYRASSKVFTPGIMEALRGFMPMNVMNQNFWLRFSLARDGDSFTNLLASIRASAFTMIGIETDRGEVFGSFTARPWRIGSKWYGSEEAFLWRLKQRRYTSPRNSRNPQYEKEIEVYPCTGDDDLIQYCTAKTIAIGGGEWQHNACPYVGSGQGIGLVIDGDLVGGETNSCATFANPELARYASSSNEFVISNLEVWSMTPCSNVEDATKFEMRDFFLRGYDT
eukprot:CAMPEP_0116085658 /NCGR_PEP_ID=MMETSP0327-20121206/4440_1 /TAXON_ID=44447 /ORGANISM="Pseudo-nitzschia delicatissima, Strain B596" /LENGTH=672 /DNA_ID=CAMNT_0003576659 /DNA_START=131 /DNA_END=2149 /DNA_ORIENTATION=-